MIVAVVVRLMAIVMTMATAMVVAVLVVISVGMVTPPYNPAAAKGKESLSTHEGDAELPEADKSSVTSSPT